MERPSCRGTSSGPGRGPGDTRETAEVAVIGDDLAAVLDRERSEVRVVGEVPAAPERGQQATEHVEMLRRGLQQDARRLGQPCPRAIYCLLHGEGRRGRRREEVRVPRGKPRRGARRVRPTPGDCAAGRWLTAEPPEIHRRPGLPSGAFCCAGSVRHGRYTPHRQLAPGVTHCAPSATRARNDDGLPLSARVV